MNNPRVQDALRLLNELIAEREHELQQYTANVQKNYDDEADTESPIFDSF